MNEKMTKIMLIIMGVILALLLGLTAFLVLNMGSKQSDQAVKAAATEADAQKQLENTTFVSLGDSFTINCKDDPNSDVTHFVKFDASLVVDKTDATLNKLVGDRVVEIRDEIGQIVRNMSYSELTEADIYTILSNKIVKDLSKLYGTTKIYKVRFSNYLTQ